MCDTLGSNSLLAPWRRNAGARSRPRWKRRPLVWSAPPVRIVERMYLLWLPLSPLPRINRRLAQPSPRCLSASLLLYPLLVWSCCDCLSPDSSRQQRVAIHCSSLFREAAYRGRFDQLSLLASCTGPPQQQVDTEHPEKVCGSIRATSNLITHLSIWHPTAHERITNVGNANHEVVAAGESLHAFLLLIEKCRDFC